MSSIADRQVVPRGAAVGFSIRSAVHFATLRSGGGAPLYVDEDDGLEGTGVELISWPLRPGNPFEGRLLQDGETFWFWANDAGWYRIEPAHRRITMSRGWDPLRRELRMFGIPTAICSAAAGDASIHAASVEVSGAGILLAGPTRYGKTTLAAGFARAGHRLLSEDTTRTGPAGPVIHPGPAALRLREDVGHALALPGAQVADSVDAGRVPLLFDADFRGTGAPVPLRLIVIVREPSDEVRLEVVRSSDVARDLLALTFRLPTTAAMAETFDRVVAVTGSTRAVHLHRPMTFASLDAVVDRLIAHLGESD